MKVVKDFYYLGSFMEGTGRMTGKIDLCIMQVKPGF